MKFKTFIYNSNSEIIYNFYICGGNAPLPVEQKYPPWGEYINIFRKNASKYVKFMIESYVCDNLNQVYWFFSFLTKKCWKECFRNVIGNHLQDSKLIYFVHLCLYFAIIKTFCSFFLFCFLIFFIFIALKKNPFC